MRACGIMPPDYVENKQKTVQNQLVYILAFIFIMMSGQGNKPTTNQPYISIGSYRYRQSDLLGSGYSSKVYKASHSIKKFQVALKIIEVDKIQSGIHKNLLDSELRCLEALKGTPHVINLLDVVKTEGFLYVVTELCKGDLMVKNKKKIPETQLYLYMKQLLKGYKSLYDKDIIHRDIKPENLLIKSEGQIKIGDFGFATTFAEAKQQVYYNIGSPSYMSPQVLHRNDYSFASDIWAIGVTFYELATGKLPWKGESQQMISSQLNHLNIEKTINLSGLSEISKKFLEKTLKYQSYNRIKPEQIFQYQFYQLPLKISKQLQYRAFDKNSFSTAETPRAVHKKFNDMLSVENNLNQSKTDFFDNIYQKPFQLKNRPDKHSRRLSFDISLIEFEKKKQQFEKLKPQQKTINSQKTIRDQTSTAFKKKHRTSFDVVHQTKLQKDVSEFVASTIDRLVKNHLELINILYCFLEQFQKIGSIEKWAQEIHVFKVCLRNYIIITIDKLSNLDNSDLIEGNFSQQQVRKHVKNKKIDVLIHESRAKLQQNKQLARHWIKAKQQKPRAISNAGLSIIKTIKKTLTNSPKSLLDMVGRICGIIQIFAQLTKNPDVTSQPLQMKMKCRRKDPTLQALLAEIQVLEKMR